MTRLTILIRTSLRLLCSGFENMHSNNYLLRERNGVVENIKEWYNPDTHAIVVEDEHGYSDVINLHPDETPEQYMNIVAFQSTWCKY